MSYTATILATLRNLNYAVTPSQLQDILLTQGVSIKRGTVKRILYRLWRRGQISRKNRGLYFFELKGDNINHSRGQKGTNKGVINHSKKSKEITNSQSKRGQQKGLKEHQSLPSIQAQVFFIFWNNKRPLTLREVYSLISSSRKELGGEGYVNYRTVQSAIYHYKMLGILENVGRGKYRIKDWDLAERYMKMRWERGTPKGPSTPLPGTIPLPTIKYTNPRIKGVIVPRDIFERVINHPPRIDPLLVIVPPSPKDHARQWKIETENVKVMIPEKTLKATIYCKGPEWKTDLVDLFGGWILVELQGKKWMTEAAINMKELLHFKTMQARAGDLKVSVDRSIFGDDYDLEFEGEVLGVNTALIATLIGPAKFADAISHLKEGLKELAMKVQDLAQEIFIFKNTGATALLEKRINDINTRLEYFEERIKRMDKKLEIIAGGIVKVLDQTSPPELSGEVQGYA